MSEFDAEIDASLAADGSIPRDAVLRWIDATADSELLVLAKLYRLTGEGYYRIQPELGGESTCALIQRYLLGCIRENVSDSETIQGRYEAAQTLHVWFRHLHEMEGTSAILQRASSAVTNLYLESAQDVRDAIETGFLEHALETAGLRPYFEHWAHDTRLTESWERALAWGNAHPDFTWGLFQRSHRSHDE
jgi:hypothetical protein